MEFIIFKNPKSLSREEKFGGLVKLQNQLLILGKKEYMFLKKIIKYINYNTLNKNEKEIANKLIEFNILLKIEKDEAEKIIKNYTKNDHITKR